MQRWNPVTVAAKQIKRPYLVSNMTNRIKISLNSWMQLYGLHGCPCCILTDRRFDCPSSLRFTRDLAMTAGFTARIINVRALLIDCLYYKKVSKVRIVAYRRGMCEYHLCFSCHIAMCSAWFVKMPRECPWGMNKELKAPCYFRSLQ